MAPLGAGGAPLRPNAAATELASFLTSCKTLPTGAHASGHAPLRTAMAADGKAQAQQAQTGQQALPLRAFRARCCEGQHLARVPGGSGF